MVPIPGAAAARRQADIPCWSSTFSDYFCTANKKPVKQLQPEIMEIFEAYSWPGNVREWKTSYNAW